MYIFACLRVFTRESETINIFFVSLYKTLREQEETKIEFNILKTICKLSKALVAPNRN